MADVWRPASRHFWLLVVLQFFRLCFCDTSRGVKSFSLVGIRMCNLLCIQRGGCEFFLYNHDLLSCRLVSTPKPTEIGEGYFIRRVDKSKELVGGACPMTTCNYDDRCLKTHHEDTVCVEDKQHSKKNVEDKHYSMKNVEDKQHPKDRAKDRKKQPAAEYFGCFNTGILQHVAPDVFKKEKADVPFDRCVRICHEGTFGIDCSQGCYCHFIIKRQYQRTGDSPCNAPKWLSHGNPRCGRFKNLAMYNITRIGQDRSKP